jgi:penicillin-binding protein 1A
MSRTAPSNRDTSTGDPAPDAEATPETSRTAKQAQKLPAQETSADTQSRDWKETVAAVTSTVTEAAIDAVTIVGDAARSLTGRSRDGEAATDRSGSTVDSKAAGNGNVADKGKAARNGKATEKTSREGDSAATPRVIDRVRDKLRPTPGDDAGNGTKLEKPRVAWLQETLGNTVGKRAATARRSRRTEPAPETQDAPANGTLVEGAAAVVTNGTATKARETEAGDAWAFRPGTDVREPAWMPSLRQRSDRKRSWLMRAVTFLIATMAGFAALVVIAIALLPRAFALAADSARAELILPEDTEFDPLASRTRVLYSDGSLMAILHGEQDRNPVSLEKMPDHAWQAIVAEEDRKFFEHEGYDPMGIGRALVANFQAGGVEQGGSTISQQVARMNFEEVGADQSIERKLKEIVYAMALERRFGKNDILNRYVNQVYFGAGAYGLQAASEEFFDTNVVEITVDQAALLAGLISSPSAYNPRENPERAKQQRDLVLQSMATSGYITETEAEEYMAKPLEIAPKSGSVVKQPSVVEAVMKEFKGNPLFGATEQEREDNLFNGGLRIKTTINRKLQKLAERTVEDYYPGGKPTAAIAAVNPKNGAIVVAASSRKNNKDNFSLALQGRRQPGSSFKPFVMAEALRQGYSPGTTLSGKSPVHINMPGEDWDPQNYGGASYGQLDMRTATAKSVNTYYAQLMMMVGAENVVELTEKMGIPTDRVYGGVINPAMVLGGVTHGITPVEMASAYGTFARNGVHVEPHLLAEVKRGKKDLLNREPRKTQVLEPGVNAAAVEIMKGPVSPGGTAPGLYVPGFPIIGKTGTTQDDTDAWFVGTTPVLSTAVWVGYPEGQVSMPGYTGGRMASPLWQSFMSTALDGRKPKDFPEADDAEFIGKTVKVPDVTGLPLEEAMAKLAKRKLVAQPQQQASEAPAGTVIWVSPNDEAQMGTTVYVGVSTGQPPPPPEDDSGNEDDEDGKDLRDRLRDELEDLAGNGNGNGRGPGGGN